MRPAQTPGGSVRSQDSGRRPRWVSLADASSWTSPRPCLRVMSPYSFHLLGGAPYWTCWS